MLLCCFLFLCLTAGAQYENKHVIIYNDTVEILNKLTETKKNIRESIIDVDSSIKAYQNLLGLSRKANFTKGTLAALNSLGVYYGRKGAISKAYIIFNEAIQIAGKNKKHQERLGALYNDLAIVLLQENKLDSAAACFLKVAALARANGDRYKEATSYNNVSEVFRLLKVGEKQLQYLHKALVISLSLDKESGTSEALIKNENANQDDSIGQFKRAELKGKLFGNLGDIYVHMNQEDSIAKGKTYLASALKLARQHHMPDLEEGVFTSLAVYHMDQQQYDKAIKHFEKAIATKAPSGRPNMGFKYAKLGECYFQLKDFHKAATLLERAIAEANKYNVRTELSYYYGTLAKINEALGEYKKATKYYNLYVTSKDSIEQREVANAVYSLQYQYETAQKDNELLNNRLKISEQQSVINRNRIILLSVTVITLLSALSIWLYLRNRQRLQRQSEQQALEIAAWRASLDGEEKERRRLAKELHDNIGGNLSTLKMWLGNIRDNAGPAVNPDQDYDGALHLLDHTLMEVRNTAHHLMPELLLRLGLAEAIRVYCNDIQRATGIKVNYQYLGYIGSLDDNIELLIYRTVQELVQNVVKHARANYLLVQLSQFDKTLSITIEDNGSGMNTAAALQHQGMGLSSIKDSISRLKGNFSIHSESGNGTTVEIEINTENNVLNNSTIRYDN